MQSTYSMYLSETFWDCLVLMVRIYIWSAARWSAVSYFSSDPNLSSTTSLQLWRSEQRGIGQKEVSLFLLLSWNVRQQHIHSETLIMWAPAWRRSFHRRGTHLNIEVFECDGVSPKQFHGILWDKGDAKKALHLVRPRPLCHLRRKTRDNKPLVKCCHKC